MRLLLVGALLLALTGCGPSPEETRRSLGLGPTYVAVEASRNGYVYARLSPSMKTGRITGLEIQMRHITGRRPGSDTPKIPQLSGYAAQVIRSFETQQNQVSAAQALAIGIARATYCRQGQIGLNTGITRITNPADLQAVLTANGGNIMGPNARVPDTIQGTPVPPIEVNGSKVTAELTCNSPNPYANHVAATKSAPPPENPAAFRARIAGKTFRNYSEAHGTQVYYLSPTGQSYLWYPGNTRVVAGTWVAEPNSNAPQYSVICFAYQNSYNPVTRISGGRSCMTAAGFDKITRESTTGDLFNLSSGRIPHVLGKREASFAQLKGAS